MNNEITSYVGAVRGALADLPDATRDELIDDLPEHLAEVEADGAGSLVDRLGTPEAYAAELRATAGFVGGFPDPPVDRVGEFRDSLVRTLRDIDHRTGPLFGYARASEFLILLRPAWWVLRGYLAAMVVAVIVDDSGQPHGLLPRIGGSELVAVLLLAAGILGSIWLGRRAARGLARWSRYSLYAGSVVLVLVALGGFLSADSDARGALYTDTGYSDPYGNVHDVFVYDRQGRLVQGARLFDQDGQPITLGSPTCDTATTDVTPVYPYCPQDAPFVFSSPSVAPSPSVAESPSLVPSAPLPSPSPSK